MIEYLHMGLSVALTLPNLVVAVIGTAVGIVIGALPGLTATMGVALLVPATFLMSPVTGLIMLSGIYCGAIYGGSISAILINVPGTAAAIATAIDGNKMTKKGEPKKALSTAILASFVGGLLSAFALLCLSPILANIALRFGPPEYFCLALFGMSVISSLTTGGSSLLKGIIVGFFGIFVSTVGIDPCLGIPRYTFNTTNLMGGFSLVPVLIGVFSIPEALEFASSKSFSKISVQQHLKGDLFLELSEYFRMAGIFIKSSIIGIIIGIIPAVGPETAPFITYREAKRSSKHPEKFGTGIPDGIVAAEAANNGATGGSLIPLLTLGIPGSAAAAVYVGALTIHGLLPGPMLFRNNPDVVYGLFVGFFMVQFIMLGMGLGGSTFFAKVLRLPKNIIATFIFLFSIIGAFAMNSNLFDVWVMLGFGILGFVMKRSGFPLAPVVLGLILGPILEENMFSSLAMGHGNPLIFVTRPLSLLILIMAAASIIAPNIRSFRRSSVVISGPGDST
jgi:putative tricarboxylic transport membrane protein